MVLKNEGKPGRPPGLQPEGPSDVSLGEAADTRQTRLVCDSRDLDMIYKPITETNIYNLPEVEETADLACCDEDNLGPIDFIPTANAVTIAQGPTDPACDDVAVMMEGRANVACRNSMMY